MFTCSQFLYEWSFDLLNQQIGIKIHLHVHGKESSRARASTRAMKSSAMLLWKKNPLHCGSVSLTIIK